MSADQLRRAADVIEQSEPVLRVVRADGELTDPDAAVAALLRAATHRVYHFRGDPNCRQSKPSDALGGVCLACRLDDVAAAYLGEDPQP